MAYDENNNVLMTALAKRQQGRGMKGSEIAEIRHYEQALVKGDRAAPRKALSPYSESTMVANRDTLAKTSGNGTDTALAARVAVLEALLAGMSRQTISYCSSGTTTSKTIVMT
tara:strand:+ start:272 stop:610 length:339 start_codon:yes stop_codon:yes gene_type:complete